MSDIATRSMRIAPRLLSAGIAMALLVSACALNTAPDRDTLIHEELPNMKLPAAWVEPSKAGAVEDNWVAALGDQQLSALVVEAITYNSDLRIAAARVEAAEAGVKAAGAQMYPSVTLLGRTGGKVGGDGSGIGGVIVPASWEIDLWGRVRYGRRAAEDQYASAEADAAAAAQSVAALVAKSWFLAIEARQQRDLAAEMVASSRGSLRLAEDRKRIGPGSELEVNQADASLQTLLDVEQQLGQALAQALRSLELLLGRYPAAEIQTPSAFAALPATPASGVPSELLERRPDVIAAQRRIDAAFNLAGQAEAARLPQISLTAGLSSITSETFVLQNRDNPQVGFGATLFATLFDFGRLEAQADARRADQKQAAAIWAQTGLKAFGEVEGALSAEATLLGREPLLVAAVRQNNDALSLETTRYRIGSNDMRSVLQQQQALYSSRSALLRVQAEQHVNRVNLYLALGGGFGDGPALASSSTATSGSGQ
ncbi:MAG TPA: TolC family protein [Rhodanobacteraceae bacterium]|nr:TolC family protein [Rhodanobacteraceae bacterium]